MKRCLYCYQPLAKDEQDFHQKCNKQFFGINRPPALNYTNEQMQELAREIIIRSVAVTGAQPKLSLRVEPIPGDPKQSRFTIVGLWGNYILKPPTPEFPHLPENEDVTMHLSEISGIPTALHSLIRLQSGELAYITKRFDRSDEHKLALEDMCQLTERLTEDKYRGSAESIGKQILKFSRRPGLDVLTFFEITLLSFITGNADMHLKNFALLTATDGSTLLSPAYDLLSTQLAMPEDEDEAALTINGKKRKLKLRDFDALAATLKIPERAVQNSYSRISANMKVAKEWIDISFLPKDMKVLYKSVIDTNMKVLQ